MDKDNEVKKERKYYTSGPGKPPIFIQAILYEKKMSAIDFFHLTDACLDWEKQGDDIAVIEPLVTLLAAWGDDLIFAFHDTMAELLYSLDTQKIAGDIYKDRSFSADEFLYIRCAALINSKRYYNDIVSGRRKLKALVGHVGEACAGDADAVAVGPVGSFRIDAGSGRNVGDKLGGYRAVIQVLIVVVAGGKCQCQRCESKKSCLHLIHS